MLKSKLKVLVFIIPFLMVGSCKTKQIFGYEMVCQGVGVQGSNLVKVYSYGKTADKAREKAKKDAVHGILFKGIAGGRCSNQPAIVSDQERVEHKLFFNTFFKGDYLRFVSLSTDGNVSAKDRLKVGNQYKVGVVVSVNKTGLRKYLEDKGIVKKLGHIFN